MTENYKKILNLTVFATVLLVIAAGVWVVFGIKKSTLNTDFSLILGGTSYSVAIADTKEERFKGLSEQQNLGDRQGMWFDFETDDKHEIVMRDMNFAIDIVWLDKNKLVVGVEEGAEPDSYPDQVFKPPRPVRYALELPAGSVDTFSIDIGQQAKGPS